LALTNKEYLIMKYPGGSCLSQSVRLSKAGVAGMKRGVCCAAAAAAIIVCLGAPAALADTNVLPDPGFYVRGPELEPGSNVPIPVTPGIHNYAFDYFEAPVIQTVQFTSDPSVRASVVVASIDGGLGLPPQEIEADLWYDVEFTGPSPDVLVDYSGCYELNGGSDFVVLTIGVPNDTHPQTFLEQVNGLALGPFSGTVSLPTGTPILVTLTANASLAGSSPFASAILDPYFSIDPSNADASAYSILVSPGIGNSPSTGIPGTPEPSTWAMMLLGFASLGWLGYSRQRVVTPAAPLV
jgi:PEP-CTERM motif